MIEHDKLNRRVFFCGLWISEARAWMLVGEYRQQVNSVLCGRWSRSIASRYEAIAKQSGANTREARVIAMDLAIAMQSPPR